MCNLLAPPLNKKVKKKSGFTLIEFSMVIVVIGLLIGGVLAGQDLIKAAKIRGTISQAESYKTAITTFRLKYNCLPGDCENAYDFFGPGVCGLDSASGTTTACNGNGDKNIHGNIESVRVWQHLEASGLINEGIELTDSYPVISDTEAATWIGRHFPTSKYRDTVGFNLKLSNRAAVCSGGQSLVLDGIMDNPHSGSNVVNRYRAPKVPAYVARNIDQKIDDGHAAFGNIESYNPGWGLYGRCTSSFDPASNTDYRTDEQDGGCSVYWCLN